MYLALTIPSQGGVTFLAPGTHSPHLNTADTILEIESDLPWTPANQIPHAEAQVFVIDSGDPLKVNMGSWHVGPVMILRADPEEALKQILQAMKYYSDHEGISLRRERRLMLAAEHHLFAERMRKSVCTQALD